MQKFARVLSCLLLAALFGAGAVRGDVGGAGWTFREDEDVCVLEQPLPDLGTARFTGSRGGAVRFELLTHRDVFADGIVEVARVTPPWHREHPAEINLGGVPHRAGASLAVEDPMATGLLMALYGGYQARLRHESWYAGGVPVDVRIGSMRLRAVYERFASCLHSPSAFGWAELQRSRVEYAPASYALGPEDQQRLQDVARYAAADRDVRQIYVDGHTDDVGSERENLDLSRRRAETVRDALVALGVPSERVVVRYHGARYPVADNGSEAGRSQNRRTTIRLERQDPQDEDLAAR